MLGSNTENGVPANSVEFIPCSLAEFSAVSHSESEKRIEPTRRDGAPRRGRYHVARALPARGGDDAVPGRGVRRCTAEQVESYHARVARTVVEHLHLVVTMRREPINVDGTA